MTEEVNKAAAGKVLTNSPESRHHVIGIGASAGGLEALSQFVAGLPRQLDCVYVIAQHMSPTHRSMMADILGRETRLPVREIIDDEVPGTDIIYIIPPGTNLVFQKGRFHLTTPSPEIAPKPSINLLFQSMAEEYDERAVGVILSGTGSDGTRGLRAIKAVGGVTFVQVPETAKYDGMPRSAIDACLADRILSPDQMGRELERLLRFPGTMPEFEGLEQRPAELTELFDRVRQHTKIDFSSYKLSTVQRRLQRRMVATNTGTLAAYLAYTDAHSKELDALAKETLISVTEFFRDKDAFRALERFGRELVPRKQLGEEIRIWVVGCATGEEAYSLAILFSELIAESGNKVRLQIFATDIDNDALTVARRGIYNQAAMAEMPQEYIGRYFQPSGNGFEPAKSLRDCVTFARQDITVDPPFLRVDLVTCRNVMIYFNAELQAKVLSILRYALRDDGLLFLGRSETASQQESLFSAADRRARIFRPRGQGRPVSIGMASVGKLQRGQLKPLAHVPRAVARSHDRIFLNAVADCFGPAMLMDAGFRILHSHGDLRRLITFPTGSPEMNLAQLIVPEFANELLTTLYRARRRQVSAFSRKRRVAALNGAVWRLAIHPLVSETDEELFLVAFEPAGKVRAEAVEPGVALSSEQAAQAESSEQAELAEESAESELASTREHLQTLMEEMAASSEEMQALNEEIQAANEELQATNEELEASNEELQATNEELVSVNEESQIKSAELAAINSEFESVYNTMDFPVVVFDPDLFLRRANGAATRSYDMPMSSSGQHINRLKLPAYLGQIEKHLGEALLSGRKESFPAEADGQTYQVFVTPVLNTIGTPQGVVLVVVDNTDLVVAHAQIQASQERLLEIMNHSVSLVWLKDAAGRYEFANQRFEELFGIRPSAIVGKTDQQLFSAEIAHFLRGKDLDTMRTLAAVESVDELKLPTGSVWLESIRFPIFDQNGVVRAVCTQASDITRRRHADEQLRLAAKVFDRAGEAIVITDPQGVIITVNEAFTTVTGYLLEEVIGKTPNILQSGQHSKEFYAAMWRSLAEQGSWQGEIYNRRKNGEIYPEWLTINSVKNDEGEISNYVSIFSDITAIKSSQRRIEFLATHDELTGLPNRSLLVDRLKHALSQAKRQEQRIAVLFIDLDNFKNINDTLGHDVGDILLKQAAERLQRCVRDSDTLARLGGDEFVAILSDLSLEELNAAAGRVVDFLGASFRINEQNLYVSASIGISIFPEDGTDSATLLKAADTAMYRAKDRGRNQYQFFADEMKVVALQRMTLETGLRLALDAGHLHMVYQPKVALGSGVIVGGEALLRWTDPFLGVVSPATFIPVAEGCGLMAQIGERVFDLVLAQIVAWRAAGFEAPKIAINVSAHQLRDAQFVEKLAARLDAAGVPASAILIELTESALVERIEVVRGMLQALNALGIELSIDDFGTGYSSLAYLRKLPLNELKVDRSFVDGIADEPDDRSIAKAVIDMAHALGLRVVAEGVETEAQLAVLRAEGCEIVQGFLLHRPLSPDDFSKAVGVSQQV
jgi:two-component system CheB/CheR fusion protein